MQNVGGPGQASGGADVQRERVRELHYITPISNLEPIMTRGVLSHRAAQGIAHSSVALETVQDRRRGKRVPGGHALHDYANVYFDARNPMMYRLIDHRDNLAVVRINSSILDIPGTVISDGNAASGITLFSPSPSGIEGLSENLVFAVSWNSSDPWDKIERKRVRCAEVLVPNAIPPSFLEGCYAAHPRAADHCKMRVPDCEVTVNEYIFFL